MSSQGAESAEYDCRMVVGQRWGVHEAVLFCHKSILWLLTCIYTEAIVPHAATQRCGKQHNNNRRVNMNQQQLEILSLALRLADDAPKTDTIAPVTNDHFIGHYCIVRSSRAGVFAGTLASRSGQEVCMTNARRIWYWDGAASLSQLATSGTSKPENCKFPAPVPNALIMEVVEILPTTAMAERSIKGVTEWTK